jgi:hypothetical protein
MNIPVSREPPSSALMSPLIRSERADNISDESRELVACRLTSMFRCTGYSVLNAHHANPSRHQGRLLEMLSPAAFFSQQDWHQHVNACNSRGWLTTGSSSLALPILIWNMPSLHP